MWFLTSFWQSQWFAALVIHNGFPSAACFCSRCCAFLISELLGLGWSGDTHSSCRVSPKDRMLLLPFLPEGGSILRKQRPQCMERGAMDNETIFEEENLGFVVRIYPLLFHFCLQEVHLQSRQHFFCWLGYL